MAKKTSSSKSVAAAPVVTEPVMSEPVVVEPVVVEPEVDVPKPDAVVSERFDQLSTKVTDLQNVLRDLQVHLKTVQKELVKLVKANMKKTKSRSSGAKKTPSGFAKPTKLSDALCDFLSVPHGTELARTDVTRRINAYIKENELQDPADKRKIHPDSRLANVLDMKSGDVLTFFNLQQHLKNNFIKTVV